MSLVPHVMCVMPYRMKLDAPVMHPDGPPTRAHGGLALLAHAPALLAFCAPTTNSYRRLVPGYEAPVNLVFSQRNRSAAVRIPMYLSSPKAKRIEFRPPDPLTNPYLGFSALMTRHREYYASYIGVTGPQYSMMTLVAETPNATVGDIAELRRRLRRHPCHG